MTSKIVVNNIESDSGINTVTIIGDVSVGSSITATDITAIHHGSGADLTNLPAANLTGTLPAIDGSNLTGVGASFGNSSVNTSGIITATAFIPSQGQLSHRNIIVNGAMMVAQRGTSSTTVNTYSTVDRMQIRTSGVDEQPTMAQVDVASGTTPYSLGFRKAFKITNGNQTSGAGASDYIWWDYRIESQDMANCGWNYTSSSSFITFSYWIKSSVAQTFKGYLRAIDGTSQGYPYETGSLTANTWTKIIKTIPGNSNISFDNDEALGFQLNLFPFYGTDATDNSVTENAWGAFSSSARMKDNTSTWYTTNDATLEITGVQLEVGPVATPFEHLRFAEELHRCQRYCQVYVNPKLRGVLGSGGSSDFHRMGMSLLNTLRTDPSATWSGTQSIYGGSNTASITGINSLYVDPYSFEIDGAASGSLSGGTGIAICAYTGGNEATITLSAEL